MAQVNRQLPSAEVAVLGQAATDRGLRNQHRQAELGRVQLTIKGVEAQARLKVRLDNVARIIDRVLTTVDNNPHIVERLIEQVGDAAEEVGAGASQALGELGPGERLLHPSGPLPSDEPRDLERR